MTLMFDSGVILKGEIRCSSPSGIKGLSLHQIKSAPSQAWTTRVFFLIFLVKSAPSQAWTTKVFFFIFFSEMRISSGRRKAKKQNYHTS